MLYINDGQDYATLEALFDAHPEVFNQLLRDALVESYNSSGPFLSLEMMPNGGFVTARL